MTKLTLNGIHEKLKQEQGSKENWWPLLDSGADRQLEILIGAMLLAQTKWPNVEKAISAIYKDAKSLDAVLALGEEQLKERIRTAGVSFYKTKGENLYNALNDIKARFDGKIGSVFKLPDGLAKDYIRSLKGIGRETTLDYIMLFAGDKKALPATPQARRILSRLGHLEEDVDYRKAKRYMEKNFSGEVKDYQNFTAQLVDFANNKCTEEPACKSSYKCPLEDGCIYRGANEQKPETANGTETVKETEKVNYDIIIIKHTASRDKSIADVLRAAAKQYDKKSK